MSTVRILVVDDKQENLNQAKKQFNSKNVELTCCPIFSAAVDLLDRNEYDILLTDLMMLGESNGINENNAEIGKEVPYGLVLAIMAKNNGVEHVAILTDISHHSGPIAWAMDRLLGSHSIVSGFNTKDWLQVAEKFMPVTSGSYNTVTSDKKTIMLAGVNDTYKFGLQSALQDTFNVIVVEEISTKEIVSIFVEKEPDFIILIGEINKKIVNKSHKYDVKGILDTLLSIKNAQQKVIVSGFMESDEPYYLRLPVSLKDLMEKLTS